VVQRP